MASYENKADEEYRTENNGDKLALIINITKFSDPSWSERLGAKRDHENLEKEFQRRNFKVKKIVGLVKFSDVRREIQKLIDDHSNIALFLLSIGSHGNSNDQIIFSDTPA